MSNPSNVRLLYLARGIRGFGDGFATIILPAYLDAIGYNPIQIGVVLTGSLLGTAVFTLAIGRIAPHHDLRTLLLGGTALMAFTGLAFPNFQHIAIIVIVALSARSTLPPVILASWCRSNTPCSRAALPIRGGHTL